MDENEMPGLTTREIVRDFSDGVDEIIEQFTDDDDLGDDSKARLIQLFEEIGQYVDDALGILATSCETE